MVLLLVVLVIFWTPCLAVRLLRAQHARTPNSARPQQAYTPPPNGAGTDTGSQDGPAWGALDDRQLTRLLTDSAPRTITE